MVVSPVRVISSVSLSPPSSRNLSIIIMRRQIASIPRPFPICTTSTVTFKTCSCGLRRRVCVGTSRRLRRKVSRSSQLMLRRVGRGGRVRPCRSLIHSTRSSPSRVLWRVVRRRRLRPSKAPPQTVSAESRTSKTLSHWRGRRRRARSCYCSHRCSDFNILSQKYTYQYHLQNWNSFYRPLLWSRPKSYFRWRGSMECFNRAISLDCFWILFRNDRFLSLDYFEERILQMMAKRKSKTSRD